jgi:hypothetical protein
MKSFQYLTNEVLSFSHTNIIGSLLHARSRGAKYGSNSNPKLKISKHYHIIYETINVTILSKYDIIFYKHDQITEDRLHMTKLFKHD